MPSISPFKGYFVDRALVGEVVVPAYDSLSPAERREFTRRNPRSYLSVMQSPEDYPDEERPAIEDVLADNAARLDALIRDEVFVESERACIYLYRLQVDGHVQTGIVAEIPVAEYDAGRIKKHEHTREDKEEVLTRYLETVGASSSPVCVAYPQNDAIDAIVARESESEPYLEFDSPEGVRQTIWCVEDAETEDELIRLFAAVPGTYLTDGHHRSAAASRYAARRRAENPAHTGRESYNFLLVALFPHDQLRILPYNRRVRDLNGHSVSGFFAAIDGGFVIEPLGKVAESEARPRRPREFGMLLDGEWYRLTVRPEVVPEDDPVGALDVTLLQEHVLGPALGIEDPRTDPRMEFVPGTFALDGPGLGQAGERRIAFAAHATSIEELIQVADTNRVMPPKSTWFDPKVRSGLFLRLR
jgi:uncharacterized protein (DUF1015 family)